MDKYIVAPPLGSTNNSVGAEDGKWQEGYFEKLPNWQEYLAESTGYGIVSGCEPSISGLTVTVGAGIVHLADGTRKELSATNITLDSADPTNPRIDIVYITSTGEVAKVTGTAAASPSAPGVPSGGISVCNVTIAAGATTGTITDMRDILPRFYNTDIVNVKDFGAVGDGVTDDTAAIQAAATKARQTGMILYIPIGTFMCGALDFRGVIGVVGENEAYSELKCNTDVDLFIDWQDVSMGHLKYFKIDGNGHAKTCIDTSYTLFSGPSCNNRYEKIRVRGFKELGWKASNNNDVWWDGVQIVEPAISGAESISAIGEGGPITIQNCNFLAGVSKLGGQYISLINNVFMGIDISGNGWNAITIIGGYLFANNYVNINITQGTEVWGLNMIGCHIENGTPNGQTGYILSGGGEISTHRITINNNHIFQTSNGIVKLIGNLIPSAYQSVFIDVIGGVHLIDFSSDSAYFAISKLNINEGGTLSEYMLNIGQNSHINPNEIKLNAVKIKNAVDIALPSNTWVDLPAEINYSSGPFMGFVMVRGQMDAPSATFLLSKTGGWNQSVTTLQSTAGIASFDAATIECQFSNGKFQIKQNSVAQFSVTIAAFTLA